jgi:hypothetical protein
MGKKVPITYAATNIAKFMLHLISKARIFAPYFRATLAQ